MPDEAANIIYVLCTETSSYVNGAEIHINGGQHVRRHRTRARADAKGRYGDGGGLYLEVAEGETKSWLFKCPQSNGIVERLNRSLFDDHFPRRGPLPPLYILTANSLCSL